MRPLHPSFSTLPAPLALNPLSPSTAHLLSFLFTSGYVGSIYLSNVFTKGSVPPHQRATPLTATAAPAPDPRSGPGTTSPPPPSIPPIASTDITSADPNLATYDPDAPKPGERDHPDTIRRRIKAVSIAAGVSLVGVWGVVKHLGKYGGVEAIRPTLILLGLYTTTTSLPSSLSDLVSSLLPYFLAPTLLLGPLYATYLDRDLPFPSSLFGSRSRYYSPSSASPSFSSGRGPSAGGSGWGLIEWRNYFFGPLTEELVFRSALLSVAILSGMSIKRMVYSTPFYFGVAHAHHAWEVYKKGGKSKQAAIRAIAGSVFQLAYTTLFGWFATYAYLRTGSVLAPLSAHVFCNLAGIYLPHIAVRRHPQRAKGIWATYIVGIAGFVWGLRRM